MSGVVRECVLLEGGPFASFARKTLMRRIVVELSWNAGNRQRRVREQQRSLVFELPCTCLMMNLFRLALSTQRATHYLRPKVHVHLEEVETNKAPKLIILHH
jgi:hypothetical protein